MHKDTSSAVSVILRITTFAYFVLERRVKKRVGEAGRNAKSGEKGVQSVRNTLMYSQLMLRADDLYKNKKTGTSS